MRGRLLLALASLAISLLICEVALRALFVAPVPLAESYPIGIRVAGGDVRVRQREYETRHRYNRFGFRDDDLPAESADTLRVLVLGDSFAEGLGVGVEQRFSSLLPGSLAAGGRRVVVINAGQIGTAPVNYANNVADFGIALRPNVVLVTIYAGNDLFRAAAVLPAWQRPIRETLPPAALSPDGILALGYVRRGARMVRDGTALTRRLRGVDLWSLMFGSRIDEGHLRKLLASFQLSPTEIDAATRTMEPALLRDFYAGLLNPTTLFEAISEHVTRARGERPLKVFCARSADVQSVARLMARLRDIVAERGGRLAVVVIPDVYEMMPAAQEAFLDRMAVRPNVRMRSAGPLRRKLVVALERAGVPTVDPSAELAVTSRPAYHVMDGHLNDAGHRIVADAIARVVH